MHHQTNQCKRKRLSKKTIPKLRSRLPVALLWACSLFLFIISSVSATNPNLAYMDIFAVQLAVLPFGIVLVEVVFRTLHLFEEMDHLQTRHENKISKLIQDIFDFPIGFYACSISSLFLMVIVWLHYKQNPLVMLHNFGSTSVFMSFLGIMLSNRALKLNRGSLYDSLWIENSNGLDYGSGMAHSFFHGYLKIVIPKTGNQDKHLEELMRNYEDNNQVSLYCYKLFILIPKSLTCPPSLMNTNISPSIEESRDINRALANNYPDDLRPELIERKRAALKRISFIETAASHKEIPHVSNKTPSGIQCASSSSEIHQPSNMQNIDSFRGSASWIESSNGLDYGSGMAHSFFYGYLKLVISETDTTNNHLKNLMKIYEANNNVKFECYKMFILIPKSLHCPMSLKNKNNPSIEESRSLPEKVFTVAGVKDRVYKNSVYKIKTASRKMVYVVAEYATPLKTFHDVIISNAIHSKVYEKYKDAIVLQFYRTLKQIVEDNESCTNHCQLIFYDDKDDEGKYYDVGQILLDQLMTPKRTRTH